MQNSAGKHRYAPGSAEGSIFLGMLVVVLVAGAVAASFMLAVNGETFRTQRHVSRVRAFNAAEAGLQKAIYALKMTEDWDALPTTFFPATDVTYHQAYSVRIDANDGQTLQMTSTGIVEDGTGERTRRVRIGIRKSPPAALQYTMFGNSVGFHNHMGEAYGLSISNRVWSNGDIVLHEGLIIEGAFTAVGEVKIDSGDPPTDYSNCTVRDGDKDSAFYAPDFNELVPEEQPFPTYDFERAKAKAIDEGTYFGSKNAFAAYLDSHTVQIDADGEDNDTDGFIDEPGEREFYALPIPMRDDPDHAIVLHSKDNETGIVSRTEVSGFFYVDDTVELTADQDTLLIMRDAAIISKGNLKIARPTEIYSLPDEVLTAVPGSIEIKGGGGPVHLEGVTYCMGTTHIHQTDPYDAVYFAGTEIADYIHNCEWFRQEYKEYAYVNGLSDSTDSSWSVEVYGWHEVP